MHAIASEPFFKQIGFDVRVIMFAIALALVAPLIFTVLPTLRMLRRDVRPALNEATLRSVGGGSRGRSTLVVLQVALAVTLAVVSALVVQSVRAVSRADLGYNPSRLIAAQIDIPEWKVAGDDEALRLRQRLIRTGPRDSRRRGSDARHRDSLPALRFADRFRDRRTAGGGGTRSTLGGADRHQRGLLPRRPASR